MRDQVKHAFVNLLRNEKRVFDGACVLENVK